MVEETRKTQVELKSPWLLADCNPDCLENQFKEVRASLEEHFLKIKADLKPNSEFRICIETIYQAKHQ